MQNCFDSSIRDEDDDGYSPLDDGQNEEDGDNDDYDHLTSDSEENAELSTANAVSEGVTADVSDGHDGSVMKTILKAGIGHQTPTLRDEVEYHVVGKVGEGVVFDASLETTPRISTLNEVSPPGLQTCIGSMKNGEKCVVKLQSPVAFGADGLPPHVGPNSCVEYEVELVNVHKIEDIKGDSSVVKKILKQGIGHQKPAPLWKVKANVCGRYEDKVFFEEKNGVFHVGSVQPIGLDTLLKSMKMGEKCVATLSSIVAYGENGLAPDVPPDAAVEFEVEVVELTKIEDLSKNGGIIKETLNKISGYKKPRDGCPCVIDYCYRKPVDGSIISQAERATVEVGDELNTDAMDRILESMSKGEQARAIVKPEYAFGASVCKDDVELTVTLHDFVELPDHFSLDSQQKFDLAEKLRTQGNAMFQKGQAARAYRKYSSAVQIFDYISSMNGDDKKKAISMRTVIQSNMAACKLRLRDWGETIRLCTEVLKHEPQNTKALYRRGKANIQLENLWDASNDLKKASQLDPGNVDVQKELDNLALKQKQIDHRQKSTFSKMFST